MDGEGTHSPMDENGWLPIETAPKDDTPVLVWADAEGWRGQFARVCASYHRGMWRVYGPILGEPDGDGRSRQWLGEVSPTHWQPLPNPPVLKEQGT